MRRAWVGALMRVVATAAMLSASLRVHAGEVYVFQQSDGTRLITDQKYLGNGLVHIRTYGRPTAYRSCGKPGATALQLRGGNYDTLIDRHAAAQHVPPELVRAVMHVESCFEPRAVSRVGARGLMQLMPDTASLLGVKDSFDAAQNIEGGVRYLRMMRDRFPNDWKLVLAAYNAGPNAVDRYKAVPPYPETQSYVKKVMALYEKQLASLPPSVVKTVATVRP